jgi:hypothetical protein
MIGVSWAPAGGAGTPRLDTCIKLEASVSLIYASVIGVVVGTVAGVGALQLRVAPLFQSVAAVFIAVLLGTAVTFSLWFYPNLSDEALGGYFSFGVENLVFLSFLLALSAVLHGLLGLFSPLPWLVEHRALALSCASGLYSSVSVALALNSLSKLNIG